MSHTKFVYVSWNYRHKHSNPSLRIETKALQVTSGTYLHLSILINSLIYFLTQKQRFLIHQNILFFC